MARRQTTSALRSPLSRSGPLAPRHLPAGPEEKPAATLRAVLKPAAISVLVSAGAFFPAAPAWARSSTPDSGVYVTNGTVNAVVTSGATTYIGGKFTQVGPATGPAVGVNSSGSDLGLPRVWGGTATINAVEGDGSGGFYIGGNFTSVGGVACKNLAHIQSNGSVQSSWCPDPNSTVNALALSGSTLYVGGAFTKIGVGEPTRERIAAICATNNCEGTVEAGHATAWAPNANEEVNAIAVSRLDHLRGREVHGRRRRRSDQGTDRSDLRAPTTAKAPSKLGMPRRGRRTPAGKSTRSRSRDRPSTSVGPSRRSGSVPRRANGSLRSARRTTAKAPSKPDMPQRGRLMPTTKSMP